MRKQLNSYGQLKEKVQGTKPEEVKEKFKCEQEMLSIKFKTVCEKLHETNIAFHEAKSIIKNYVSNIHSTVSTISELVEEGEQKKITLEMQKLKDEKLRYMTRKIRELQRENHCNVLKINKREKQLQEFRDKYMQDHDCYCFEKKFCHILRKLANKSSSFVGSNN